VIRIIVVAAICVLGVSGCFEFHDLEQPSPESYVTERFFVTVNNHPLLKGSLDATNVRVISGPESRRGDFMEGNVVGWHQWCMTWQVSDAKLRERVIKSLFTLSFQQTPVPQSEQHSKLMNRYFDEWKSTEVLLIQASERFEKEEPKVGRWHFSWNASTNTCS
jgi:hypothetical protein